jgi:hypothetical protein
MKVTRFVATLLFLSAFATSASAIPLVSMSWDACTGPIDKAIAPGSTASVFASVIGHDTPHKAYQVQLRVATGTGSLPDAWRFDPTGCQTSAQLTIDHLSPLKAYPSFQGALASQQVKDYSYNGLTGVALSQLFNAYPNLGLGNTVQIVPATRYFLGRWLFNHAFSVNGPTTPEVDCGGLEAAVCQASVSVSNFPASWVDIAGATIPWTFAQEFVTTNGHVGCPGATPTKNTTWGNIKDQYKR